MQVTPSIFIDYGNVIGRFLRLMTKQRNDGGIHMI